MNEFLHPHKKEWLERMKQERRREIIREYIIWFTAIMVAFAGGFLMGKM